MAYKSLSQFIKTLDQAGELVRIKEFVDPVLEIAEVTDRISKTQGGGKALLFENTDTEFPLLINSLGSERRICMALGVKNLEESAEKISSFFIKLSGPKHNLVEKLKLLPALKEASSWIPKVKSGKGVCQDVVILNPDLNKFPILKCWPLDGGRFITLPLVHTIDPDNGARNLGMYRMQVFSSNTTGMHWHRHKTGARHFEQYRKLKKLMPVAVALGGDPIYTYAATAPLPDGIDEYLFAGFLRGKRIELVKCMTQNIEVPSDADIIIEGYVDPEESLAWEGPFGDHTGFYSQADWYPVFHVTCITHRKDAVYPATIVGVPPQEDAWIAKATERIFLPPIRMALAPEIIDMNLPVEGIAHNLAVVKIKKSYPGQAFKVMNALWGAGQMMFNKVMIVTDREVDIFSPEELFKAITINAFHPSCFHFQMGPSDVLDHASQSFTLGGKIGIDATIKMPEEMEVIKNLTIEKDIPVLNTDLSTIVTLLNNIKEIDTFKILPLGDKYKSLIITITKDRKSHISEVVEDLLQDLQSSIFRLIVFVDKRVSLEIPALLLWYILGNIDPVRDCRVLTKDGLYHVVVDATKKEKIFNEVKNEWPSVIKSDIETIHRIDKKWNTLGLGELIQSPSSGFLHERIT
jgi:4-hydroxy-3-polyprenylbenzoate decarboxylase